MAARHQRDENSHTPITDLITNRSPNAIRPHLRPSQYEVFDRVATFSIRDEFLRLRGMMSERDEAEENSACWSCARLDKLKHVLHIGADTTPRATACCRNEPGQRRRLMESCSPVKAVTLLADFRKAPRAAVD